MADRARSKPRIRRAPLGDATDRIVNASPQKLEKQIRLHNTEPNPLRAHPTSTVPRNLSTRERPVSKSAHVPTAGVRAVPVGRAAPRVAAGVPVTAPRTDGTHADNRFSQISTSSGASGGSRKTHIGPWQLGRTLGKGSAARVRLARHSTTQDVVAVKILAKNVTQLATGGSMAELEKWDRTREEFKSQRHMPLSIEREVALLKLIDHPHIVKLHDIWENRAEIYLVLEYMDGGDMFSYIQMCGPLPEFEMIGYFRQLLAALEYVHSFNICHRDLKPENILMQTNGVVKIADFGMAAIQQSPTHALKSACGSPHYAAPELIARARYQGDKVDVWSLGCLLFVALCRELPFDDVDGNIPRLLAKAQRGVYQVPSFLGKEARDLIAKMLTVDPVKRIPIRKIWQHPLVAKYDDLDKLNGGSFVLKSRANDKSKPVPPEELDLQILRQLKSMWHTFSEKQLSMQLSNNQPNDQKLFYWLLFNYRERKLENYDTDLTYSPSDYHHLRPTNWKKKFTTAEFPSRYGRTPSRFTVISTVPTDRSLEEVDNVTDGGGTIMSYDPYKSSNIMDNGYASHAKIVVHRHGSMANRSSTSRRGPGSSFRSNSTLSRKARGGRRIAATMAMRDSRHSLSSIQSGESGPYIRPASRRRRGVNFVHGRMQSGCLREASRTASSIVGDSTAYNWSSASHVYPGPLEVNGRQSMGSNGRSRAGTQSVVNLSHAFENGPHWNEEVREFSHSIARDCDDAFNSSLLEPASYSGYVTDKALRTPHTASLSGTVAVPPSSKYVSGEANSWDQRPLPPVPSFMDTPTHQTSVWKKKVTVQRGNNEVATHASRYAYQSEDAILGRASTVEDEANRRIVSAPIYTQYSTQWGKDKIPLPSINEKPREGTRGDANDKYRIVSAPAWYEKAVAAEVGDQTGLDFLSRQDNTIRIVDSPLSKAYMRSAAPEPLNIRKKISHDATPQPQAKLDLNLRQRYMKDEPPPSAAGPQATALEALPNSTTVKKKSAWFRRGSKDKENIFGSKEEIVPSQSHRLSYVSANSSEGQEHGPTKKKSFNLAFWRNSKDQSQMQMSRTGSEIEVEQSTKRARSRPPQLDYDGDQPRLRNIEPQQNWLARLFKVKPATRYLCFPISRRRARQETAILLREWRKYGIRDVEVDKERNIVFARLGQPNYLDLKEVAFAIEIMTVVEHGKRGRLCIARFIQERGAASSFHRVVDTMDSVFRERNLLIVEKRKIKMMIKTLNS